MLQCAGVVRRPGTSMINERIKPSQKIYVIGYVQIIVIHSSQVSNMILISYEIYSHIICILCV